MYARAIAGACARSTAVIMPTPEMCNSHWSPTRTVMSRPPASHRFVHRSFILQGGHVSSGGRNPDERPTTPLAPRCRRPDPEGVDEFQAIPDPRLETAYPVELDSPTGLRLVVPVRVLDAKTLKRLDDHREPPPTVRRDYESLFGPPD